MNDLERAGQAGVVLSVATDGFDHVWRFCIESHRRYVERHSYAYELVRENPWPELSPHWSKFRRAVELLEEGRNVFLVDSDVLIRDHAPAFDRELADHPGKDIFAADGRSGRVNSGVVLLRGGAGGSAVRLLQLCLDNRQQTLPAKDVVTSYGENGHFIHFLSRPEFQERFVKLPAKWNRTTEDFTKEDYNIHYTGPLRTSSAVLDGTLPYLHGDRTRTGASSPTWGARYQRVRPMLAKAVRRLAPVRWGMIPMAKAALAFSGFKPPRRGGSARDSLWRFEASTQLLEHPTVVICRQLLQPGDVAIDGGGHVGYFSRLFAGLVHPGGRVVAIEAHPDNAAVLRENTAQLPVTVVESALTSEPCELELVEGSGHSNHSIFGAKVEGGRSFRVPGRTLDSIADEFGFQEVALLKLDIEGAELQALEGASGLLAEKRIRMILIELNSRVLAAGGLRPIDISIFLGENGYILRQIRDDYRLGPDGFLQRKGTFNYLAAREETWRETEARLAR